MFWEKPRRSNVSKRKKRTLISRIKRRFCLPIDLRNVKPKSKLGRQNLLESQSMQEHCNGNSSCIEQMKSLNESHVLWLHQPKKDHEVKLESKEIFCPQIEDFDHCSPYLVKSFSLFGPGFCSTSSILHSRSREPRPYQNKRKEHKSVFYHSSTNVRLQNLSKRVVVVDSPKNTKDVKTNVLMQEVSRHYTFI